MREGTKGQLMFIRSFTHPFTGIYQTKPCAGPCEGKQTHKMEEARAITRALERFPTCELESREKMERFSPWRLQGRLPSAPGKEGLPLEARG